eukprot:COSAG06_NODE_1262_length_10069_cov_2.923972_2_plen_45_part_00
MKTDFLSFLSWNAVVCSITYTQRRGGFKWTLVSEWDAKVVVTLG